MYEFWGYTNIQTTALERWCFLGGEWDDLRDFCVRAGIKSGNNSGNEDDACAILSPHGGLGEKADPIWQPVLCCVFTLETIISLWAIFMWGVCRGRRNRPWPFQILGYPTFRNFQPNFPNIDFLWPWIFSPVLKLLLKSDRYLVPPLK